MNPVLPGFASRIVGVPELYLSFHDLGKRLEEFEESVFFERYQGLLPLPNEDSSPNVKLAMDLISHEMFLHFGEGSTDLIAAAVKLNDLQEQAGFLLMMQEFMPGDGEEDVDEEAEEEEMNMGAAGALVAMGNVSFMAMLDEPLYAEEARQMVEIVKRMEVAPITLGFQIKENKELLTEVLASLEELWVERGSEASDIDVNGESFRKLTVVGSMFLTKERRRAIMKGRSPKGKKKIREFISLVDEKEAMLCYGFTKDDYLVVYMGKEGVAPAFAELGKGPLASSPKVELIKPYLNENLLSLLVASGEMQKILSDDATGEKVGKAILGAIKSEELDTTLLAPMVKKLVGAENRFYDGDFEPYAGVAWMEQGIRGEGFGGPVLKLDSEKKLTFNKLVDESVFMAAVGSGTEEAYRLTREYLEAFVELVYGTANSLGALPVPPEMLENAVPAFLKAYEDTVAGMGEGLGGESAIIIDLEGSLPKLPAIPKHMRKGFMPRIAVITEVENRDALAQSWETVEPELEEMMEVMSPNPDEPLPMPEFVTSEAGGVKSYFIPFPLASDNFMPAYSLNDKMAVLSTSKELNEAFAERFEASEAEAITGSYVRMNFRSLVRFGNQWSTLMMDHAKDEETEEDAQLQAMMQVEQLGLLVWGLSALQSFEQHIHLVDGEWQTSTHFCFEDIVVVD